MFMTYLRLASAALFPVAVAAILYIVNKKTKFGNLKESTKQIVYGIVFGILSIVASEFGVPMPNAKINVRDAGPIIAGLFFGSPAGIISGLMGGIERYLSVYWGGGTYTQVACSLSTVLAGFLSAGLRRFMFDNKRPTSFYGLATGVITELFHMLMIILLHFDDVETAFSFVKVCSIPMIVVNSLAVFLTSILIMLLSGDLAIKDKSKVKLSQEISRWLLLAVAVAFFITSQFTYTVETRFTFDNLDRDLRQNIDDVEEAILDASDEHLLSVASELAIIVEETGDISTSTLTGLLHTAHYDITEINVVDENGIIIGSNVQSYLGYDMASGEQSAEFMPLLTYQKQIVQEFMPNSSLGKEMKYGAVVLESGGFLQVGFDESQMQKDIADQVVDAGKNRHVGSEGAVIISDPLGKIASAPKNNPGQPLAATGLSLDKITVGPNERFEVNVYGVECYAMYHIAEGYYIFAVQPTKETLLVRDLSLYTFLFMEALIFALLFIMIYFLTKKLVVDNIKKINESLDMITEGNLNVIVKVQDNEEFSSLSRDINSTVETLKGLISEAAARIDKELEVAKVIQSSSLPKNFDLCERVSIYATMDTAKEVGGDFFDFYMLDENHLAFLMADVSGKGITAAMFMMKAKTILKDFAEKSDSVAEIIRQANEALCTDNEAEMFVTCWMGILDFVDNKIRFANAGHNHPLLKKKGGAFEYYKEKPGFVLGGMAGMKYKEYEFDFEVGDEFYVYTDGITEATDANTELYGDARLLEFVNTLSTVSSEEFCVEVKKNVDEFVGEAPQFDDMTMLHLRRLS